MSWSIANINNTVKISKKIAHELFNAQSYDGEVWYDEESVTYKGKLMFNEDHMEYMDYVGREFVLEILKKNQVKGIITFGSMEGDNAGRFWGYEFDGEGNMTELTGALQWAAKSVKKARKT